MGEIESVEVTIDFPKCYTKEKFTTAEQAIEYLQKLVRVEVTEQK